MTKVWFLSIAEIRAQITRTRDHVCNMGIKRLSMAVKEIEALHLVARVRRNFVDLVPFELIANKNLERKDEQRTKNMNLAVLQKTLK